MLSSILPFVVVLVVGWLVRRVNKGAREGGGKNPGTPRVPRLIERIQAQQAGSQPTPLQGQYTQPASGQPLPGSQVTGYVVEPGSGPGQSGVRVQTSTQFAGMLRQFAEDARSGQQYSNAPGQFQPAQAAAPWQPPPPPPHIGRGFTGHRPPQNKLPTPNGEIENRVRELISTGNEVGAVRLLCDEQDMGIIEAQEYARSLGRPAPATRSTDRDAGNAGNAEERSESAPSDARDEEPRYVGSAAFAESVFNTDPDENVWASGWTEKPDVDDRTDIEELWQTVKNQGRPTPS